MKTDKSKSTTEIQAPSDLGTEMAVVPNNKGELLSKKPKGKQKMCPRCGAKFGSDVKKCPNCTAKH